LRTSADVIGVLDKLTATGVSNAKMLLDLFHLHMNGDDVSAAIDAAADRIGHVQLADAPGRGEPGSGGMPWREYLENLELLGYRGWIGLEYKQSNGDTERSLEWLPREYRTASGIEMKNWKNA